MALLFIDGFDASDTLVKWNLGGDGFGSTTTPYGNGRSWSQNSNGMIKKSFTASAQIFVGFMYRTNGSAMQGDDFVRIYSDAGVTQHLSLRFTDANTLALYRGATSIATASAVEPLNIWSYIELSATIHDSTGNCQVRINSVPLINFTGDTRNAGTSTNIDAVSLNCVSAANVLVDDFYLCNSTGSAPYNTFLGEVRVATATPNGAGSSTQFTPSSGANYTTVDELPYLPTDYVSATASGTQDLYTMSDIPSGYSILAVQNNVIAKKTDAGGTSLKPAIKSGSTVYYGSTTVLISTDATLSDLRTVDPATGTAWTLSGVNSLEAGMEIA
jgi:hypothetical protein